jgi:hypothetical protein
MQVGVPPVPPVTHHLQPIVDTAPQEMPPPLPVRVLRKRIAVARLSDTTALKDSPFGQDDATVRLIIEDKRGDDRLTAMLIDALHQTDRFIIVERENVNAILRELEFQESKWVDKDKAAKAGEMLGAQLIVAGALGNNDDKVTQAAAPLCLYLRVYDVATSRVLASTRAIGRDRQDVVDRGVQQTIDQSIPMPWTGRVAQVAGDKIYINAGLDVGVKVGDKFRIISLGGEIRDPDTNAVIGYQEQPIGKLEVVEVAPQLSTCKAIGPVKDVKRGDKVQMGE